MKTIICFQKNVEGFKGHILGLKQPVRLLICGDKDTPGDKVIVAFVGSDVEAMVSTAPSAVLAVAQDIEADLGANFAGKFEVKDPEKIIHCPPGLVAAAVVSQCWDTLEENLTAIIDGLAADPTQQLRVPSKAGAAEPSKRA